MGTGEPGEIPAPQEEQAAMAPFAPLELELFTASGESWPASDPQAAASQSPQLPEPSSTDAEKSRFWDVGGGLGEGEIPDFHVEVIYL